MAKEKTITLKIDEGTTLVVDGNEHKDVVEVDTKTAKILLETGKALEVVAEQNKEAIDDSTNA